MVKKSVKAEAKDIGEGLGISGFTLGILSVVFAGLTGILISIIGIILSGTQQKMKSTKLGKVGLIINIISLVLSVGWVLIYYFILRPKLNAIGYTV